jgi:hypothetical protein
MHLVILNIANEYKHVPNFNIEYHMLFVKCRKNVELKFKFEREFAYKHSCFFHNSTKLIQRCSISKHRA